MCVCLTLSLCVLTDNCSYRHLCLRQLWGQHPWGHLKDQRVKRLKERKASEFRHVGKHPLCPRPLPLWPFKELNLITVSLCMCVFVCQRCMCALIPEVVQLLTQNMSTMSTGQCEWIYYTGVQEKWHIIIFKPCEVEQWEGTERVRFGVDAESAKTHI